MSWHLARSLEVLRDQINKAYPNRSKLSDGTIGDAAHQTGASDHNPDSRGIVKALDLTHDPGHGMDAGKLADVLASSRDSRIGYLIWNRRILIPSAGWRWQQYAGINPHTKHIHVSVTGTGADDARTWKVTNEGEVMDKDKVATPKVNRGDIDNICMFLLGRKPTDADYARVGSDWKTTAMAYFTGAEFTGRINGLVAQVDDLSSKAERQESDRELDVRLVTALEQIATNTKKG